MLQIVTSLIDAARGVIYDHHMFIVQATGVFVLGRPFQPGLMFVSKARACLCEAPLRCSTLGVGSGITYKQLMRLENPARSKHSSLLGPLISF